MSLPAGSQLGPYVIDSSIGTGGMGEVYKARDTRLGRTVAIKVLPESLASDNEFRERFEREARSISVLNHPNICTLYDVGRDGDVAYLVLEHLEGETLATRLRKGPLPLSEALAIATAIASALDAAHRLGIVHRDLKPANVMLTAGGAARLGSPQAKLLDFGLAKVRPAPPLSGASTTIAAASPAGGSPGQPLTARGTLLGTFQYMAPEQIEGEEADARTDLFALGAVMYEMLTGRRPFDAKSQTGLMAAILKDDPAPVSRVQPLAPPAFDNVVRCCLEKNREARFQSAHDVLLQLRWIAEGGGEAPATPSTARPAWIRRSAWAAVTLFAMALTFTAARYLSTTPSNAPALWSSIVLPAGQPGNLALSPDGRSLAFEAAGQIWVRSLSGTPDRPLAGTEGARMPFWSPDSRFIAFFTSTHLKKIEAAGGPALSVCECPGSNPWGNWGAGDVILFAPKVFSPIYRVPAAGGTPVPVTTIDVAGGETSHFCPFLLPDGRHFLYHVEGTGAATATYVGSLDSTTRTRLLDGASFGSHVAFADGYLLYSRDNTLFARAFDVRRLTFTDDPIPVAEQVRITRSYWFGRLPVFTISQAGLLVLQTGKRESQLTWVDRSGKPLGLLGGKREYGGDIELSPDGTRLAISVPDARRNHIWFIEVKSGAATQLTFGDSEELGLRWSRDGSRVVYRSIRPHATGGPYGLYERAADGGGAEALLLQSDRGLYPDGWSPDEQFLFYEFDDPATPWDLWTLSIRDRKTTPFIRAKGSQEYRRVSPGGRWVAYASSEDGPSEVFITTLPDAHGKWRVSSDGGSFPRWRSDGRELFYRTPDGYLMAAAVEAGPTGFRVTGVQRLFKAEWLSGNYGYDVSRDGQRFLLSMPDEESANLPAKLVVNWTSALRR
jgi:serine/threonine protein kinase